MTVREDNIQHAIDEVLGGTPQKEAAANWGIAPSTLHRRLHGAQTKKESKIPAMRLTPAQEEFVAHWAKEEEKAGRAPGYTKIRRFAQRLLVEGGDMKPLGVRWVDRFLQRHPEVKVKPGKLLEQERAKGSTKEAYQAFYDDLATAIREKDVIPSNISNMDEHGMQELETQAGKVIGDSLTDRAYVTASNSTTWVSVIECCTATGKRLNPVVVFTGATLQGQWFPPKEVLLKDFPGWKFEPSLTGWSNNVIAVKWLREIYLPETKPARESNWRILIIDEHDSHKSDEFVKIAIENKVRLVYLPPHTSHKTQPLDVSVFTAVKTYFRQEALNYADFTASAPVNKRRFLYCYKRASEKGMEDRNIRSGFRKSGIWPFNPQKVMGDPTAFIDHGKAPAVPSSPTSSTPSTPRNRSPELDPPFFFTPKKSQDIRAQLTEAVRDLRTVATKAGKALDEKNAENAALRHQVDFLNTQLESNKPYTRKKVKPSGPEKFAAMEAIIEAQEASQLPPKRRRTTERTVQPHLIEEAQEQITQGLQRLHEQTDD